jgi:hypothetical protein
MLIGDYNVISCHHHPRCTGFFPYAYEMHDELERLGFVAAHDLRPRRSHPHSWIGRPATDTSTTTSRPDATSTTALIGTCFGARVGPPNREPALH